MFSNLLTTARDHAVSWASSQPPSYSFKTNFNTTLSSAPLSSSGFLPSLFPTKISVRISVLSQSCYMPPPSHVPSRFLQTGLFIMRHSNEGNVCSHRKLNTSPDQSIPSNWLRYPDSYAGLSGEQKWSSPTMSRTSIYNVKVNQWINRTIPPLKAHGLLVIPCAFLFLYSDHVNWSV